MRIFAIFTIFRKLSCANFKKVQDTEKNFAKKFNFDNVTIVNFL